MAEVSVTGLVTTGQLTGSVAVMARYQGQVDVFRATVPLGVQDRQSAAGEELHRRAGLQEAEGARPAAVAGLRRRDVPPPRDGRHRRPAADARRSRSSSSPIRIPNKRDKLVDRLLDSTDYADYFANKWSAILRNKRRQDAEKHAHVRVPRLDSREPAREQAVRPVRPRDPDRHRRRRARTRRSAGIAR